MNKKPLNKKSIINIFKRQNRIKLDTEWLRLENCKERILAEDIKSKINVPPFNNSAVDGYAILKSDIKFGAKLICKRRIAAGDNKIIKINKGEVIRIFTGARMPENSRTVVMQENTKINDDKVVIKKIPIPGENHRIKGEDIKRGQTILKKGTNIVTNNLNLIAAIGVKKVKVLKKIKVGFFTSGNELKKPRTKLKGSEINNSNYYSFITLLDFNFINKVYCGNLKDRAQYIENKLKYNSKKFNIIITTGGASVGEEDYLIEVINKIGKILFWKAAIKPGRPVALGKVDDCYVICLPGNPVSVQLLYALIIQPFIYYLAGAKFVLPQPEKLKVNFNMNKKTKRMEWLRVKKKKNNLEFIAEKFPKQGSGMISSIAYSDGIIEIPEHVSKIKIDESYDYFDFKILFS